MTGLLTAREVAELMGVSSETILRWTRRGDLPAIRLPGGALRYREAELDEWLSLRATRRATLRATVPATPRRHTVTSTAEKTRETRLRRMAERQGLTIRKSRRRDPRAIDYGRWWVVHSGGDRRLVELKDTDALERYLTGER